MNTHTSGYSARHYSCFLGSRPSNVGFRRLCPGFSCLKCRIKDFPPFCELFNTCWCESILSNAPNVSQLKALPQDLASAPSFAQVQQQVAHLIRGKIVVGKILAALHCTAARLTHFSTNPPPTNAIYSQVTRCETTGPLSSSPILPR